MVMVHVNKLPILRYWGGEYWDMEKWLIVVPVLHQAHRCGSCLDSRKVVIVCAFLSYNKGLFFLWHIWEITELIQRMFHTTGNTGKQILICLRGDWALHVGFRW